MILDLVTAENSFFFFVWLGRGKTNGRKRTEASEETRKIRRRVKKAHTESVPQSSHLVRKGNN